MDLPPDTVVDEFQDELLAWARNGNLREFPWRQDTTPFEVLVAEILLQQTFAAKVEPVYEALLAEYPTPEAMSRVDPTTIAEVIESLGFQNQRARALVANAGEIAETGVPTTVEGLKSLSYFGDYAANATLCFGFDRRRPIVDTNVERVYERAFDVSMDATDDASWVFAEALLPDDHYQQYNLALLDLGATLCTPRAPDCQRCPVESNCDYANEGTLRKSE